ncbi:hypothetical protein IFM89_004616, partial [Coptis chinensis]
LKRSQSALALKKYVEESQKLALECTNLLNQCTRWEKECLLYDRDREALMEFANEADERAKEAEVSETQLIEEFHLMREKITMLEQSRLQECSDNPIHYSKCSSLKADDQIPRPHVLAAMPVSE